MGRLRLQQSEVRKQKNVLGKGGGAGEERNGEEKIRLKPIGRGFLLAKEEVAPSPGAGWRRRRRRRRAPPRSCSTLWGGKAARNLPDPPLHPPPASPFPPPRSSRRLPPSSPKPAASTDLSNGCTFLGAGRGVAERLNPGRKQGGVRGKLQPGAPPAARRPGAPGEEGRKANEEGSAGRHLGAARAPSPHSARPHRRRASSARTHRALGGPRARLRGFCGPAADPRATRRRRGLPGL